MKKIIIVIFAIVFAIIAWRMLTTPNNAPSSENKDQIDLVIESITSKVELGSADPRCQKIDYFNSNEFTCLKAKGESCNVNEMDLVTLKDIDKRLEKAIQECLYPSSQ